MGKVLRKKIDVIKLNKNENLYKITQDKRLLNSFREIYVSGITPRSKKKRKLSNYITQNIFILNSKIKIIYKNKFMKKNQTITLSNKNSYLITIPKKISYHFVNLGNTKGYIINFLNKRYQQKEK